MNKPNKDTDKILEEIDEMLVSAIMKQQLAKTAIEVQKIVAEKKANKTYTSPLVSDEEPVGKTSTEENDVFEQEMAATQKRYQELVGDPNTSYADAIDRYMEYIEQEEAIETAKPSANRTR